MSAHERERLAAWMDGELAPEERAAVEAHLAQCEECAALLADMEAVDAVARELEVAAPEGYFETFPGRVRARIKTAERRRRRWRTPAWTWAAAAALLLGVVTPLTIARLGQDGAPASKLAPGVASRDTLGEVAVQVPSAPRATGLEYPRTADPDDAAGLGAARVTPEQLELRRPSPPQDSPAVYREPLSREGGAAAAGEAGTREGALEAGRLAPGAEGFADAPGLASPPAARAPGKPDAALAAEPAPAAPPQGADPRANVMDQPAALAVRDEKDVAAREAVAESEAASPAAPPTAAPSRRQAPAVTGMAQAAVRPAEDAEYAAAPPLKEEVARERGRSLKKSEVKEAQAREVAEAFQSLRQDEPRDAAGWRQRREAWRTFVAENPTSPLADRAWAEMVRAGVVAWRLEGGARDRDTARRDGEAYLAREKTGFASDVKALLEELEGS